MRLVLVLLLVLLVGGGRLAAQGVEARGITSEIKLEEVVFGHLAEINGKFKLRATEVTFAPGAYLGVHHHVGPGIRYVLSGEVTFTEGGQTTIYKTGDYFSKPATSPTRRKTTRRIRFAFCLLKFCRRTGPPRPSFPPNLERD